MKRNPSIELYRIGLMFGICLLHAIDQGGYVRRGLDNLVHTCLTGFVFITGYYGIRFKWSKILKLLGVALYCALPIAYLKTTIFGWEGPFVLHYFSCARALKVCWFLWSYIALLMLAPIVNPLVDQINRNRPSIIKAVPFFILVFGWSYLAKFPYIKDYVPIDAALLAPALHFLAIYVAARCFAVLELERYITKRRLVLGLILCGGFCWLGFYHMNSPFSLGLACLTFIAFKRVKLGEFATGQICGFVTPSLFSIYLIHTHGAGFEWIHRMEHWLFEAQGCPYLIGVTAVAIVVFMTCLIADLPRRIGLKLVNYIKLKYWVDHEED